MRPHQDFMGEPGIENPQNVFEKMMALHDQIFNGLIGTYTYFNQHVIILY